MTAFPGEDIRTFYEELCASMSGKPAALHGDEGPDDQDAEPFVAACMGETED